MRKLNLCIMLLGVTVTAVRAQHILAADTVRLARARMDSTAVRKLVDSVFAHKEEDPAAAIRIATFAYHRALTLKNVDLQASALSIRGAAYADLSDYQSALTFNYQALRLFERLGNAYGVAMLTNNIGRVYSESGKLADAADYLAKAAALAKSGGIDRVSLYVYINQSANYTRLHALASAIDCAQKADTIASKLHMQKLRGPNFNNLGALHFFRNEMGQALACYRRAQAIAMRVRDSSTYYRALVNIAEVDELRNTGDPLAGYMEALAYFTRRNDLAAVEYACTDIANLYKKRNNARAALRYFELGTSAARKNLNLQSARNMALLQTKYETEKKEQQIALLNKQNTIQKLSIAGRNKTIGIIAGLFVATALLGWLFYNRYRLNQESLMKERMLQHREALTSAVIRAEEQERARIAGDLHDGVGQLFSAVKMNLGGLFDRLSIARDEDRFLAEKTLALVDESCREVRAISHQMMPNAVQRSGLANDVKNFIDKLDSETLNVNLTATGFKNTLEDNAETVLYRVIQEAVNNVIKHAAATNLDIVLERLDHELAVAINDDGVGFDTSASAASGGIGLKNIAARVGYLMGTLDYYSAPGEGTRLRIRVPLG